VQANFIQKIAKSKPSDFELPDSAFALYRRFFSYIWRQKWLILVGSSTIFGLSFLQVLIPQITRYVIDIVIPERRFDQVPWLGFGILCIAIIIGSLNFLRSYTLSLAGQQTLYDLRRDLYSHLQTLSLSFFENQRTGTLMSRVTRDVESVEKLITTDVAEIIAETVTFIVIVSYLLYADWQLTVFIIITLPAMVALSQFFGSQMRSVYQEIQTQSVAINNHLQETLSNIKLIKAYAKEDCEIERFAGHNLANQKANIQATSLMAGFAPIIDVMNSLGHIVVLSYGSWEVMQNRLSVGELTAFLAYLNQINQPIKRYSRIINVLQKGATSLERIFELLDQESEVNDKPDAISLPALQGMLQFEQVEFAYSNGKTVLNNISFEINPGMTVALVGSSGAGKTTIANLAARFYDPQKGRILVDGHDLRDVQAASLRQQMGIVSQETLLLHSTVRENIAYAKPDATPAEIEAAATLAYAHTFIVELPQGYETVIGERGVKLSGGQRQRIAIARALLANPRLLILDEATSSLDTESEYLIQKALQQLLGDRTCLVIAHRLSTIQRADLILVIEHGKIFEQGTHQTLLKMGGRYAQLQAL
jgi:ABC-type multidrug transport system fused ATPase/permease subunit